MSHSPPPRGPRFFSPSPFRSGLRVAVFAWGAPRGTANPRLLKPCKTFSRPAPIPVIEFVWLMPAPRPSRPLPPALPISLATTRTAGEDGRPWPRLTAALPAARPCWGGREGGGYLAAAGGARASPPQAARGPSRRGGGVVTPARRERRVRFPPAAEQDGFVAILDPSVPPRSVTPSRSVWSGAAVSCCFGTSAATGRPRRRQARRSLRVLSWTLLVWRPRERWGTWQSQEAARVVKLSGEPSLGSLPILKLQLPSV